MTSTPKTVATGFSLIEIVVSLFIVSVMFGVFQVAISTSQVNRVVKNQEMALRGATTELEKLRALGFAALPGSGSFSNTAIDGLPAGHQATRTITTINAKTRQVVTIVSWKEPGRTTTSSIQLTTFITEGGL